VAWLDHTTLFRWRYIDASWRVDETYAKVAGSVAYLYRAIDNDGQIIDFMLSPRRTAKSARRFLAKPLRVRPRLSA
jgi:transposase, IS6 family